jgi:hypothetical protein
LVVLAMLTVLALTDCSSAPSPPPVYAPPPQEPVFIPPIQTPQCFDESYYVGVYRTARELEVAYFQSKDAADGTKAVDLFLSYLECAPSGSYAMSAHLRKARLHCAMGSREEGRDELRSLSEHPEAGGSEVIDAKYVYDFCEGLVDFRGHPLPRDSGGS